jgi:hypothetical protein
MMSGSAPDAAGGSGDPPPPVYFPATKPLLCINNIGPI